MEPSTSQPASTTPVPDPTLLTTAALTREIAALKELLVTRLDGMDKAQSLFEANLSRVPTDTDKQIYHLKELHDEKFASIQVQFRERDVRAEQSSKDSKVAVDAALQAAKEAVGEQNKSSANAIAKSETATAKQIDQISQTIQANTKAADDKIADMKDRIVRIEGKGEGEDRSHTSHNSSTALWISFGGVLLSLMGLTVAIILAFRAK